MLAVRCSWRVVAAGAFAAMFTMGCAAGSGTSKKSFLVFPGPPDSPRIQFLTWASGAKEVDSGELTLDKFLLGDEATDLRRLNKPYGVAARDEQGFAAQGGGVFAHRSDAAASGDDAGDGEKRCHRVDPRV